MGKQMASGSDLTLPILVGVTVVAVTAILAKLFLFSKGRKNRSPVTLKNPGIKYALPLHSITVVSHDTRVFRFALPSKDHVIGLPIGQHVYLSARIDGKICVRAYTPVSKDDDKGFMDLLVKVYFRDTNPRFPDGGMMSQHLNSLKVGETIDVRGPNGLLTYEGLGISKIQKDKKTEAELFVTSEISMIAGGTGLTPMMQIIRYALNLKGDKTKMKLLYANQTEEDILLKKELDDLAAEYPDRFSVSYTLDRPSEGWKGHTGFINADMISSSLLPPSENNIVLMCGPPPMLQYACHPSLDTLGYSTVNRFQF